MRLSVVVGNPKPGSRTLTVAETLADRIAAFYGAERAPTIDLTHYAAELFDRDSARVGALNDAVAASELLVVASPTFKATYTGLLKAFLDRYGHRALAGVTAFPVMTADDASHALAVEVSLRPLLVELGASVPAGGFVVLTSQLGELHALVGEWVQRWLPAIAAAVPVGAERGAR